MHLARMTLGEDQRFFLPGAVAKDMYRPAVNARSEASRATIAPGQ